MKIFVATSQGQNERGGDFFWTNEGEPLCYGFGNAPGELGGNIVVCPHEDTDGSCGCKRAMVGMSTRKATTTFTVADIPFTDSEYREMLRNSVEESGFLGIVRDTGGDERMYIVDRVEELLSLAEQFPVGALLELRGDVIRERVVFI